jgi:hypothetical protein
MDSETQKMLDNQIASINAGNNEPRYPSGKVKIVPEGDAVRVNGKLIFKDMNDHWQCDPGVQFTNAERSFLGEYLEMIENSEAKQIEVIYTL